MDKILPALLVALWATTTTAAVYKWTDEQGDVHYSDEPHSAGAEPMDLPPAPVYDAPDIELLPSQSQQDRGGSGYRTFAIASPAPEATVRNNPGVVDVHLRLEPELRQGHRVQLYLDGEPVGAPRASADLRVSGIYRGTHTVSAAIINSAGQTLAKAGPVTFYMHRPSVNLPANPN